MWVGLLEGLTTRERFLGHNHLSNASLHNLGKFDDSHIPRLDCKHASLVSSPISDHVGAVVAEHDATIALVM